MTYAELLSWLGDQSRPVRVIPSPGAKQEPYTGIAVVYLDDRVAVWRDDTTPAERAADMYAGCELWDEETDPDSSFEGLPPLKKEGE